MSKLIFLLLSIVLFASAVFADDVDETTAEADADIDFESLFVAEEERSVIKPNYAKYQCGRRGKVTGKFEEAARMEEERWEAGDFAEADAEADADAEVEKSTTAEANAENEGEKERRAITEAEETANAEGEATESERHVETAGESETAAAEAESDDEGEGEAEAVRMVGGRSASSTEFPWHVSIFFKGKHVCSGAIIGKRYIVANAQCFKNRKRSLYKVYAGKMYKDAGEEGTVGPFRVEAIVIHGKYKVKGGKHENDIALIKLNKDIRSSKKASAVCLPEQAEKVTKKRRCFVSGFNEAKGQLEDGELRGARVSVITNKQCKSKAGSWLRGSLTKTQFCAGGLRTDTGSTCKGDLGSPLVCELGEKSNVYILQGLFSFGKKDCYSNKKVPAAYTRLSSYVTWLKKNYRRLQKFKSTDKPRAEGVDDADADDEGERMEVDAGILADDEE